MFALIMPAGNPPALPPGRVLVEHGSSSRVLLFYCVVDAAAGCTGWICLWGQVALPVGRCVEGVVL